eukprot:459086_1
MKKYSSLSKFYFLPNTPISTARSAKAFNNLANKLATPTLTFNAEGLDNTGSNFENIPKTLQSYMDYFYKEMYISGSSWNMNRDKTKYENIKERLNLFSLKDYQQIIIEGKQLYFQAFDCNYIDCKPNNPNILYYNNINKELKLNIQLESSCLKHKHKCTQTQLEKQQLKITSWSPSNFAFVEIESAFRILYGNHWIKNEMNPKPIPNDYEPKQLSLKSKKYLNNGM